MRAKTYSDDQGHPHPYIAQTVAVDEDTEDPDWTWMSGIFTLGAAEANHTRMYLNIAGPHMDNSIIVDEVIMEPLSMDCQQPVLNPDFSESTAHWRKSHRGTDISIYKGTANPAVLLKHSHYYYVLEQQLDMRCIVEGQRFTLTADFKLLNATDLSQSLSCRIDERK